MTPSIYRFVLFTSLYMCVHLTPMLKNLDFFSIDDMRTEALKRSRKKMFDMYRFQWQRNGWKTLIVWAPFSCSLSLMWIWTLSYFPLYFFPFFRAIYAHIPLLSIISFYYYFIYSLIFLLFQLCPISRSLNDFIDSFKHYVQILLF